MITKFKIFENINKGEIKAGDFIVLTDSTYNAYNHKTDKIGKVFRARKYYDEIDAEFEKPIGIMHGLSYSQIKYWSNNKEELENLPEIITTKYNL